MTPNVSKLVDHLFRQESGRLVSALTGVFGVAHLPLVEEVVQEAMLAALRTWPFRGVPNEPAAWLRRVARNHALDRLRRERALRRKLEELRVQGAEVVIDEALNEQGIDDHVLRMMICCCHPCLSEESRVALTLKAVSGFSPREIARALLSTESAVTRRLHRARQSLHDSEANPSMPVDEQLHERLDAVHAAIYLLFNEGYGAHEGEHLIREDLVAESIRLCRLLLGCPATATPVGHALMSLLCLQAARLPARTTATGRLVLLDDQDRNLWSRSLIAHGFDHLELASTGDRLSEYHIQAAIAACHARSAETDWEEVLRLYDTHLELFPSPIIALNRAVALARLEGDQRGLMALDVPELRASLAEYYLYHAVRGHFLHSLERYRAAGAAYQEALQLARTAPEREFLERQRDRCQEQNGQSEQDRH